MSLQGLLEVILLFHSARWTLPGAGFVDMSHHTQPGGKIFKLCYPKCLLCVRMCRSVDRWVTQTAKNTLSLNQKTVVSSRRWAQSLEFSWVREGGLGCRLSPGHSILRTQ